jgi:mannose-6-phosphate isomerase
MSDILLFEPVFKERIWGGNLLRTKYGYEIPSTHTGEAWVISGHHHGSTKILNGRFFGLTLDSVFVQNRHLFNDIQNHTFPLLTKILDANDDLSVQVHPNDLYAKKHANDLGKTECWYILDAQPDAYIVFGHHAKSKQEFIQMIEENRWDELLTKKYVKKGDFIYVPSGTLHAIGKGILILETQQSSDTTYRVYDYDRLDAQGNSRELHLKESIEVTTIPHQDLKLDIKEMRFGLNLITQYVSNEFFTVEKWDINQKYEIENNKFRLMSVISGEGIINGMHIKNGNSFILLSNVTHISLEGSLELIVSYL